MKIAGRRKDKDIDIGMLTAGVFAAIACRTGQCYVGEVTDGRPSGVLVRPIADGVHSGNSIVWLPRSSIRVAVVAPMNAAGEPRLDRLMEFKQQWIKGEPLTAP